MEIYNVLSSELAGLEIGLLGTLQHFIFCTHVLVAVKIFYWPSPWQ